MTRVTPSYLSICDVSTAAAAAGDGAAGGSGGDWAVRGCFGGWLWFGRGFHRRQHVTLVLIQVPQ